MCSTGQLEYQNTGTIPPHIARRLDSWGIIHGEKLDQLLNERIPIKLSRKRKYQEKCEEICNIIDDIKNKEQSVQDQLNDLLIACKICDCCEKHQINKPLIFSPWVETTPTIKNKVKECSCDCRHIARWICRQHPDYK